MNKNKEENIQKFVFNNIENCSKKCEKELLRASREIYKNFGSKTKFIKHFEEINIDSLVEARQKDENNYLSNKYITFLLIPKITNEFQEEKNCYRVMKNCASEMNSKSWFFSRKNENIPMQRFNCEGQNMLYVSFCINTAMQETLQNYEGTISVIEYKVPEKFKYNIIGNNSNLNKEYYSVSYLNLSNQTLFNLIHSKLPVKYPKEKYYQVINDILNWIKKEEEVHGIGKIAFDKVCNNKECKNEVLGVYEEFENMLQPFKVTEYDVEKTDEIIGFKTKEIQKYDVVDYKLIFKKNTEQKNRNMN